MELEQELGAKQAALQHDSSSSSSSSEEDEKLKAARVASAPGPATLPLPPNPFTEQGKRISPKDELFRQQFVMPQYLRMAMAAAVESKLVEYPGSDVPTQSQNPNAPLYPLIVMINSRSGGRKGPALRAALNDLLSKEQVFDLSVTPPKDFFRYGLRCLERLAEYGDQCAKDTRNRLRILVAGGDGTVGWVLGSTIELHVEHRMPIPPVGTIPLGTGNDLSRSFGWGGSFMFSCRPFVRRYLRKASSSQTAELDSWQVMVMTKYGDKVQLPHALHPQQHIPLVEEDASSDVKAASFEGIYYNYFSIGMDAQVAYGFHNLRERKPYLALGPISNKIVYSGCSCVQGWFCTPCSANPRVRSLRNIMRLEVKRESNGDWEPVDLPQNVRAVIMLNLQSYASGRNPWGHPTEEYNQKKRFVQPTAHDGILEIFGLFDGWHASLVMLSLRSAKRLAQACAIRMHLIADQRHRIYMQMDGEPWRQPLCANENSTIIEIMPTPTRSLMLKAS
ncbi:hypothetical protein GOP47_0001808 [Adiantum capillus-veneris]|uniref:Diacylglycerol kinase n=1 Tax=Adiantum capillus-veneris TaxID=13818 RepID=A0A9D4V8Y7_ADICA|nr:hypothetical protein GOP47_0001808 [Adiantum capillus-veneris]